MEESALPHATSANPAKAPAFLAKSVAPPDAAPPKTEAATGRTEAAPVRTVAATVGTESQGPPRPAAEQTGTRRGSHTAQVAPNPPTAVDENRISALNAVCEPVSGGNARDFRTSPKHKVTHGRITNSPVTPPLAAHRAKTPATASGICPPMRRPSYPILRRHRGRVPATEAILRLLTSQRPAPPPTGHNHPSDRTRTRGENVRRT